MQAWAEYFGDTYPLTDYWSRIRDRSAPHYITAKKISLTKGNMDAVPPDDDTVYTLLGLLTMEQYGFDFTQEDMAKVWMRYLPLGDKHGKGGGNRGCWWGERIFLENLYAGMALPEAGLHRNPNLQNIAAWTRADSYGYACPGWPEKAAELAWRDASVNHRRNGVYGSMFMAAAIAAAFAVDDPMDAVRIGLTEIPENCLFAEGVRWALAQKCVNYREAADAVWKVYEGMFNGSALTNALHVVMGLAIGGKDFTKTIGETVAMSGDNDCTGATAGSIAGAVIGKDAIPPQWTEPFRGRMQIYLNEHPQYRISKRFVRGLRR
jgi:ADP-ribosylglycohydrolase